MHVRRNAFLAGLVMLGASSGCTALLGDFSNGSGDDGGGTDATADHVATSEAGPDTTPGEGGGHDSTTGDSSGSSSGVDSGSSSGSDSGSSSGTDAASDANDSGAACTIGGAPYATGAPNPNNGCQSCQPATSTSMWTNLADGTGCGNGQVCAGGSCGTQCDIGGTVYASGTANPTNACQTCQPGTSTTQWTTVASGTSCATGEVCNGPSCVAGCYIAGAFDSPGVNPSNACQTCQPGTSTTQWTAVATGTSCATGEVCNGTSCASGCYIAGAFDSPGANPINACQTCQPSTSTTQWTSVTNGTSCGNGQICSGGACGTQCDIGGTVYTSGAVNPANACQSCQPGAATSAWTALATGTSCGSGVVCNGASCVPGCYIAGAFDAPGVDPANQCLTCVPGTNTTSWTNVADGTNCGSGNVCNTGACKQCAPNQTNPVACGNCGTNTQTCVNGGWQNNTCAGQGACAPNATAVCNTYGSETCASSCAWGACSCPSAPACTPGQVQCSGSGVQTCNGCGQWANPVACASGDTCQGGQCGVNCTKVVTSLLNETTPAGPSLTVNFSAAGGGGGGGNPSGGGAGGGSSAIFSGGVLQVSIPGGAEAIAGSTGNGSFVQVGGTSLTVYVGGGGGAGGVWASGYTAGGGGGGAGYYGGGGGGAAPTASPGGGGGSTTGGLGGGNGSANGAEFAGGIGGGVGGSGGNGSTGGAGWFQPGQACGDCGGGGGGGGYGGGGGAGSWGSSEPAGAGGTAGGNGTGNSKGTGGGGANTWASATTLPAGAGANGGGYSGANAGLVILTYFNSGGTCPL